MFTHIAPLQRDEDTGIEFIRRPGRGRSPVIMLLHGIGSNAESFMPLMGALPQSIDAFAWNAPGYGMSKPLMSKYPAPLDYSIVLNRMLDALDLSKVTLVGHSLGALFAGSFAASFPNRVEALGLLSPALGYHVLPGSPLPVAVQARIDEVSALGPAAFAAKRASKLVGDPRANPHIVTAVERAMGRVHPAGYTQAVWALGTGNLIGDLKTATAPTLVAVGEKDTVTPPETVRLAYDCLKNPVGCHVIARAGHALPQEQPNAIANLLSELVEAHAIS